MGRGAFEAMPLQEGLKRRSRKRTVFTIGEVMQEDALNAEALMRQTLNGIAFHGGAMERGGRRTTRTTHEVNDQKTTHEVNAKFAYVVGRAAGRRGV